jgi:RNA 2',3'-cyclic 3'-phosphodiesterase
MPLAHRLFFALRPPVHEARMIGLLRDDLEDTHGAVANDRLHLTLAITDDFPSLPKGHAARMREVGEDIAVGPLTVTLDRLSAARTSVALRPSHGNPALRDLHRTLDARMGGLTRADWRFNPHVTLAYRKGEPWTRTIDSIRWEARELVLIHSHVGETRHDEIGRWPLVARQYALFD